MKTVAIVNSKTIDNLKFTTVLILFKNTKNFFNVFFIGIILFGVLFFLYSIINELIKFTNKYTKKKNEVVIPVSFIIGLKKDNQKIGIK